MGGEGSFPGTAFLAGKNDDLHGPHPNLERKEDSKKARKRANTKYTFHRQLIADGGRLETPPWP
jgi:hypothetical protein